MDYTEFSKEEMVNILDIIHLSLACRTRNDMSETLKRVKDLICADQVIGGIGIVDQAEGPKIIDLINVDYPHEWLAHYAKGSVYRTDPVLIHQLNVMKPQFWSEAYSAFPGESYTDFARLAGDYGLRHGITAGYNTPQNDMISVFSFAGDQDRFHDHHKKILDVVTPHLFQGLTRLHPTARAAGCELTKREREVIRWVGEGKSNWELSMILKISESTVKFHMQNIEKKLNASNRAHAVALALGHGMLGETSN